VERSSQKRKSVNFYNFIQTRPFGVLIYKIALQHSPGDKNNINAWKLTVKDINSKTTKMLQLFIGPSDF
jgi:formylmethanofuran dehydrogenase subunit B